MDKTHISVVIPVYGCKAALQELYDRLTNTLKQITQQYEIILVDDRCPQNSWEVISVICSKDTHVKGIRLSRNFGQMRAILTGLDNSVGEWVVVMDCDLQDSPEDILKLYNKALEGYDIVFSRRKDRHDSPLKIAVSKTFYKIYSFLSDDCFDPAISNFSICKRKVISSYCQMREYHRAYTMYLKWLGYNSTVIEVEHNFRKEGSSSYNMKKRINLAIDILLSQSDKMLRFIAAFGFGISMCSFVYIIYLIISYFFKNVTEGWTSMIAALMFIGGVVIASIGIVGLYVGNIFMQSKGRPLYIIDQMINSN